VRDGAIFRGDMRALDVERLPLVGAHNALNVCAALAAVEAAGEDAMAACEHIASFHPLPHRLQELGQRDGLTWIDDSIATTPQATLEALASFPDRNVTLLVGGYERALDWHPFGAEMSRHPPFAIVTFGAIGARIADLLRRHANGCRTESVSTLADAVSMSCTITPRHGIVLLSPGAPSFDEFRDYAERGRAFATLAGFDGAAIGEITGLGIA
jgi:UDP-N-acetylmuramoyl-L-alanine---L-glutamate ligase